MVSNKMVLEKVEEIKEILSWKPKKNPLCGTGAIMFFDFLARDCLKKYEEIPEENKSDTLLTYLKETLTKLQREEFDYNKQAALNLCQTILERNHRTTIHE
ncbi:MAG: hypothetical protein NY202_02715 [Mollicutes bacterium UO1]